MKVLDYSYKKITNRKGARRYSKLYSNSSGSEEGRRETKRDGKENEWGASDWSCDQRFWVAIDEDEVTIVNDEVAIGSRERQGDERLALIVTCSLDGSEQRGDKERTEIWTMRGRTTHWYSLQCFEVIQRRGTYTSTIGLTNPCWNALRESDRMKRMMTRPVPIGICRIQWKSLRVFRSQSVARPDAT